MGGMFGINKSFHAKYKFKKISDIISDLYKYHKERPYNVDQEFLNNQLWNLLKDDVMAHISNGGRRIYDSDIEVPSVPDFIGKQYRITDTITEANTKVDGIWITPCREIPEELLSKYTLEGKIPILDY